MTKRKGLACPEINKSIQGTHATNPNIANYMSV